MSAIRYPIPKSVLDEVQFCRKRILTTQSPPASSPVNIPLPRYFTDAVDVEDSLDNLVTVERMSVVTDVVSYYNSMSRSKAGHTAEWASFKDDAMFERSKLEGLLGELMAQDTPRQLDDEEWPKGTCSVSITALDVVDCVCCVCRSD